MNKLLILGLCIALVLMNVSGVFAQLNIGGPVKPINAINTGGIIPEPLEKDIFGVRPNLLIGEEDTGL